MSHQFGWWDFESSPPAMIHRHTGQRLTCQHLDGAPPLPRHALPFVYSDGDFEFFLVIRTSLQGQGVVRGTQNLTSHWEIDYNLSLEMRRAMLKPVDVIPSYGVWARMDECVTDALGCWPEGDPRIGGHQLTSTGGWLCEQWRPTLRRTHVALARLARQREIILSESRREHVGGVELETPQTLDWRFVDCETSATKVTLDHFDAPNGVPNLPASMPLSGFDAVPHLVRHDGSAIYFPSEVMADYHRGEDLYLTALFVYADRDAVLSVAEDQSGRAHFIPARCKSRLPEVDQRDLDQTRRSECLRPGLFRSWRRACRELAEARFLWRGPQRAMQVAPEPWAILGASRGQPAPQFMLRPLRQFSLSGGFIAGIPSPRWRVTVKPAS